MTLASLISLARYLLVVNHDEAFGATSALNKKMANPICEIMENNDSFFRELLHKPFPKIFTQRVLVGELH